MQFYCASSSITPTLGSGINHPDKSDDLAAIWTEIKQPTAADICQLLVNAQLVYGSELLHGIRIDIDDAYPRLLLHLLSVSLCAVLVVVDSVSYVYFPLVSTFGIQDVNFAFQLVTIDIDSRAKARDMAAHNCQLSSAYTDDFLSFRPARLVPTFISQVTADVITHDAARQSDPAITALQSWYCQ